MGGHFVVKISQKWDKNESGEKGPAPGNTPEKKGTDRPLKSPSALEGGAVKAYETWFPEGPMGSP